MKSKKPSGLSLQELRFVLAKGVPESPEGMYELDIPRGFYLEVPEILISRQDGGFSANRSCLVNASIDGMLHRYREEKGSLHPMENLFYSRLLQDDRLQRQKAIMTWAAKEQNEYLRGEDAFWLRPIRGADASRNFGWDESKISRLVENLSVKLPSGRVTFAKELIPGTSTGFYMAMNGLKLLQQDPEYFSEGEWVPDSRIREGLRKYGINAARRTVAKYRLMMEHYQNQGFI